MDSNSVLQEIQKKNRFVFKKLFNELYQDMVSYAMGYLFDKGSSEDIVQDIFVYLWEKSETINIESSLKGYLFIMVRNRCLNHLKSIKITDNTNVLALHTILDEAYDLEVFSAEDKSIIYNQVLKIIETLPGKMKQIVKLRFIDNYKYAEIADEIGVSVNTVKTQLKRAKVKITHSLGAVIVLLLTNQ
ncbi:RNA polymerase sigma-70 factor [Snuella sedimenti]|uniref:RNA polymerase sigma-70 factor n=1 Tax=Snuella sedimenti TaxID=2798802 RepID=A0A8J7LNE2_9FLAO|nr:RNA polymerase sigma-70 factor [Snuella sedimenti]MBJ6367798.1 RNA polymerase sigma-70 factor [Snuella sedimenti]